MCLHCPYMNHRLLLWREEENSSQTDGLSRYKRKRRKMMKSLCFPAHPLDSNSGGISSAKVLNIFPKHLKQADWGCCTKHNAVCLYFSPNCSIKEAYVFIVLHPGTNTWALFSPRVFILIPRGVLQYPKWRIVIIT